jgi:NAD(P)-dependent dehydrogenase (short-subunit alcohol dehydrogenase family)
MSEHLELDGRRALVTGGTKGIGEAVAARLREAGATGLTTARTRPCDLPDNLFVAADLTTAPEERPVSVEQVAIVCDQSVSDYIPSVVA